MRFIITHSSPDLDAITSVWLLMRFLPGWNEAQVNYVPAGERKTPFSDEIIQEVNKIKYIHVDTGLGPLDHHQIASSSVCAASRTWDYVKSQVQKSSNELTSEKIEAIDRLVALIVQIDHFQELFWGDSAADYQELTLVSLLEGFKIQYPNNDQKYTDFIFVCLDALLHEFENRVWTEKEIKNKGITFKTKWGKAVAFETINDNVLKLSFRLGFALVLRKDPRKGYVRIKGRPYDPKNKQVKNVDLTLVYEQLKKMDPKATWYLHVGKKMLLNGTVKNPKMVPTNLSLKEIISVIEKI